jgi:hypothetical protein
MDYTLNAIDHNMDTLWEYHLPHVGKQLKTCFHDKE